MIKPLFVHIVAMQYNDFKADLPGLFARVVGCVVTLRKFDGHPNDPELAVAAYMENKLLGYITGTAEKRLVRRLIDASGRSQIRCIVRFVCLGNGKGSDMLKAEITGLPDNMCEAVRNNDTEDEKTDWSQYEWTGVKLSPSKEENQLQAVADDLLYDLKDRLQWTAYQCDTIGVISQMTWADLSREMQDTYNDILALLTAGNKEMKEAADTLHQIIAHIGSLESCQKIYDRLTQEAQSAKVAEIIKENGYTLESLAAQIPQQLLVLLKTDPTMFVGRILYLRMPRDIWHGFMSCITYLLRCLLDRGVELAQGQLPVGERKMKVSQLMMWGKMLPVNIAHELCRLIMLDNPMLTNDDLKALADAFHGEVAEGGIVLKDCELTGNNLVEGIKPEEIALLPLPTSRRLLQA